jgi:hypothetical protein
MLATAEKNVASTKFSVLSGTILANSMRSLVHLAPVPIPQGTARMYAGRLIWSLKEDRDKGGIEHQDSDCHHGTSNRVEVLSRSPIVALLVRWLKYK